MTDRCDMSHTPLLSWEKEILISTFIILQYMYMLWYEIYVGSKFSNQYDFYFSML